MENTVPAEIVNETVIRPSIAPHSVRTDAHTIRCPMHFIQRVLNKMHRMLDKSSMAVS